MFHRSATPPLRPMRPRNGKAVSPVGCRRTPEHFPIRDRGTDTRHKTRPICFVIANLLEYRGSLVTLTEQSQPLTRNVEHTPTVDFIKNLKEIM